MTYLSEGSIRSMSEAYREVLDFTKEGPKTAKRKPARKPRQEDVDRLKEELRRTGQWEMLAMIENAAEGAGGSLYSNAAKKSSEMSRTHGKQAQQQGTMAAKTAQTTQSAGNAGPKVKSKTLNTTLTNPAVVEECDCHRGIHLMYRADKVKKTPGHMVKLVRGLEKVKSKIDNADGHIPGKVVSAAIAEEVLDHLVAYGYAPSHMAIEAFEGMDPATATDIFLEVIEEGTSATLNEHHSDTLFFIEKGMELLGNFQLSESVNLFGTLLEEEGVAGDYYTAMDALLEAENFAELMVAEDAGDGFARMSDSEFSNWVQNNPGGAEKARQKRAEAQARARQKQAQSSQQQQQQRQQAQQQRTQQSQSSQQSSHGAPRPKKPTGGSGSGPTNEAPKQPASKTPPKEGIGRTIGREFVGKRYGDVFSKDKDKRNQAMVRAGVDAAKGVAGYGVKAVKDAFRKNQASKVAISRATPIV